MEFLSRLVGEWRSEASHRLMPGVVLRGRMQVERLGKFLVMKAQTEHPDVPNAISIIGDTEGLRMHYFDERGVQRLFEVREEENGFSYSLLRRDSGNEFASGDHGFWQRFIGRFEDGSDKISGVSQMSRDNVTWEDDLVITYWRLKA